MSEIFTVTKKELIKCVAERWLNQYPYSAAPGSKDSARKIYLKLRDLPKDATAMQVRKIIGNSSWTDQMCEECGEMVDAVAVLGNRDSDCRARICLDCLKKAVVALEEKLK